MAARAVRAAQEEMQEQLQALQDQLRNLQMGNMAVPAPQPQYTQPMPIYSGTGCFSAFWAQFCTAAEAHHWDEEQRLQRFPSCLVGRAAEVAYTELTPEDRATLQDFKSAIAQRFADTRGPAFYMSQLEQRKMGARESAVEYAADIKRLCLKAYGGADLATRNQIGVRHFAKGLLDPQVASSILLQRPQTVDDARAMLDEVFNIRETVGARPAVRAVQCAENESCSHQDEVRNLRKEVAELKQLLQQNQQPYRGRSYNNNNNNNHSHRREERRADRAELTCWGCGQKGHVRAKCHLNY